MHLLFLAIFLLSICLLLGGIAFSFEDGDPLLACVLILLLASVLVGAWNFHWPPSAPSGPVVVLWPVEAGPATRVGR